MRDFKFKNVSIANLKIIKKVDILNHLSSFDRKLVRVLTCIEQIFYQNIGYIFGTDSSGFQQRKTGLHKENHTRIHN